MNRKEYIKSRFEKILKENLAEKSDAILDRLNYKEEAPFEKPGGPFDYVQEGEGEMCEQCGSEMSEGECMECGTKSQGEVMELGGMDSDHPRFGKLNLKKLSKDDLDSLLKDIEGDSDEDFGYAKHDGSFGGDDSDDEWEEIDVELDEDESYEMKEKLYGRQTKLDKNKNGRLDKDDFKMLRNKKRSHIEEYTMGDDDIESVKSYGDNSTDSPNITPKNLSRAKVKNVGDKYQRKISKKFDDYESDSLYEVDFERTDEEGMSNVNETLTFTENELVSLIEQIVDEKNSFKMKEPKGYVEYKKAHKGDKKEEDDYMKSLAKKMTDYLKDSTKGKFEMNPKKFPQGNNTIDKESKAKKYTPSEAVEEYEDAFSYPGQTNLVFDEIKPNDKNIEKYLKGHKTTGNAQVDEDGNALGNVVPSEVGEKFYKNFKDNLYGQEQMSASYKRQPQPVDMAGEETERGSLKSKRGKKTSQDVLNAVDESVNTKEKLKLNEEFGRIQALMGYNRKTQ
jgi:hypothetical protein